MRKPRPARTHAGPIAVATPTPASEPEAVPEPSPQPAPTPLPMRLEMPTPAPKAPKSRWNTHPEPSAEELAGQDLQKAQSEFDNAWGSFSDEQRALLRQEEKEEIARMKALIAGMTPASDPAEAEKLKQKMAELDAVWNSLPPEQQARVNPGKEGWLVAVTRLPVSDQLRETEARIKFLKDNLGQFMRMPGVPPPAEDPALVAQLKQNQAISWAGNRDLWGEL